MPLSSSSLSWEAPGISRSMTKVFMVSPSWVWSVLAVQSTVSAPIAAAIGEDAVLCRARCRTSARPVTGHELVRPGRLAHLAARRELHHVGLDVEHGRPVDG